jgi:hypothetical protein
MAESALIPTPLQKMELFKLLGNIGQAANPFVAACLKRKMPISVLVVIIHSIRLFQKQLSKMEIN